MAWLLDKLMPFTIGYGWHRWIFFPWHISLHRIARHGNNWKSRMFCTYCCDQRIDRMNHPWGDM